MSANTSIEWADSTWSPLIGCERVSRGCDNCYAIGQARVRAGNPNPKVSAAFTGLTDRVSGRIDWTGRVNTLPDRLAQPSKWRRPRRVFVNSMSDLFHDRVGVGFIAQVFAVMSLADRHTFQLLTKRPGRMRHLLNNDDFVALVDGQRRLIDPGCPELAWPLPNLWLGVSVEDQRWADIRVPVLLVTPAVVRWVSAEPLLGPIDLTGHLERFEYKDSERRPRIGGVDFYGPRIGWVVTGGESGPGARPAHPDWFRALRDQCRQAGVAYLHKQHGAYGPVTDHPRRGDVWVADDGATAGWDPCDGHTWVGAGEFRRGPAVLVRRVGKKTAGRMLDGREWAEFPPTAAVSA